MSINGHSSQIQSDGKSNIIRREKPISQIFVNCVKGNNGGRINYWGKFRKPAVRTTVNTEKQGNKLSKSFISTKFHIYEDGFDQKMAKTDHGHEINYEKDEKNKLLKLFRARYKLLRKQGIYPRADILAWKELIESGELPQIPRSFGPVKGVDVGDEFQLRVELVIVGLHSRMPNGIDYEMSCKGKLLATCVVATEGYLDIMVRPDVLIYIGEGGHLQGKSKDAKDQELKRGNLALKNSIKEENFVRVVRGIKPGFGNVNANANAKGENKKTIFVYDGLYHVVGCEKIMGPYGKVMFQFELWRCHGQEAVAWEKYK